MGMSQMFMLFSILTTLHLMVSPLLAADMTLPANWEKEIQQLSTENQAQARQMADDLQEVLKASGSNNRIYMNFDQGMTQNVFSKSGVSTSEECAAVPTKKAKKAQSLGCQTIGSVSTESEVSATGTVRFSERTNSELEKILNISYEVTYKENGVTKKGWIPAELVSTTKPEESGPGFWQSAGDWIKKQCSKLRLGNDGPSVLPGNNIDHLNEVHSATKKWADDEKRIKAPVEDVANRIAPLVGKCVVPMKTVEDKKAKGGKRTVPDIERSHFAAPKNSQAEHPVIYDEKVLPVVTKNFVAARDLNIPHLNAQTLIEIDSLARTIYGEMQGCVPMGSEYPMAVARVIKNRQTNIENVPGKSAEFIYQQDPHWPGKNINTKVSSSPIQFSSWNLDIIDTETLKEARSDYAADLTMKGESKKTANERALKEIRSNPKTKEYYRFNDTGLLHTLCPPSHPPEPYWKGESPPADQIAIWKSILKIATEATLYPKEFEAKTNSLKGIRHYTSDRTSFYGMKEVCPSIEGKQIIRKKCLNLWVPDDSKLVQDPQMQCNRPRPAGKKASSSLRNPSGKRPNKR
jgi:hypothetical protein